MIRARRSRRRPIVVAALLSVLLLVAVAPSAGAVEPVETEFAIEIHGEGIDYSVDTTAITDTGVSAVCITIPCLPTLVLGSWFYESAGGGWASVSLTHLNFGATATYTILVVNDPGAGISETYLVGTKYMMGTPNEIFWPYGAVNYALSGCGTLKYATSDVFEGVGYAPGSEVSLSFTGGNAEAYCKGLF